MSMLRKELVARPFSEWHEDYGDVLWWRKFPIEEPPYVGRPGDDNWPDDYYTYWTPIVMPLTRSDMKTAAQP